MCCTVKNFTILSIWIASVESNTPHLSNLDADLIRFALIKHSEARIVLQLEHYVTKERGFTYYTDQHLVFSSFYNGVLNPFLIVRSLPFRVHWIQF